MAKKKKTEMPQTGSQSANFHEGTRSEYLAHYVFSSFGTCVPVPHPEDTGIDLHCTLTDTVGPRIWPVAYYFVQVKSTEGPWEFTSRQSVEQFLNAVSADRVPSLPWSAVPGEYGFLRRIEGAGEDSVQTYRYNGRFDNAPSQDYS